MKSASIVFSGVAQQVSASVFIAHRNHGICAEIAFLTLGFYVVICDHFYIRTCHRRSGGVRQAFFEQGALDQSLSLSYIAVTQPPPTYC